MEVRATGIPTIRKSFIENGSPEAYFETDEERSFFETTLFVHAFFKNDKKVTENFGTISEQISEQISEKYFRNFGNNNTIPRIYSRTNCRKNQ